MFFFFKGQGAHRVLPSSPTRRSSVLLPRHRGARRRLAHRASAHDTATVLSASSIARICSSESLTSAAATFSDRKSTRLNSSHANISYAVFCLKKKNIICSQSELYSYP